MDAHTNCGLRRQQFLDGLQDPQPSSLLNYIVCRKQLVRPRCCVKDGLTPVPFHQQVGGAVDVEVVDSARAQRLPSYQMGKREGSRAPI